MKEVFKKIAAELKEKSFERYGNEGMGGQLVVSLDDAVEIVKSASNGNQERDAFESIYSKLVDLEYEYAENGDIEKENRCIELEERLQYFKEELKSCNDKNDSEV